MLSPTGSHILECQGWTRLRAVADSAPRTGGLAHFQLVPPAELLSWVEAPPRPPGLILGGPLCSDPGYGPPDPASAL